MTENNEVKICFYCKSPILEGEDYIKKGNVYYHYSKENKLENCYFIEEEE